MGLRLVEAALAVIPLQTHLEPGVPLLLDPIPPQIHLEPVVHQFRGPIQHPIRLVLGAPLLSVPIQPPIHSAALGEVPSLVPQPHRLLRSVAPHLVAIMRRPRALEDHQGLEAV